MRGEPDRGYVVFSQSKLCSAKGRQMKYRECSEGRKSVAIAAAAILAAASCGGCLYTLVPALAGPSTTYPQPAAGQPAQTSQPSGDQTNQTNQPNQNKQQNGVTPNSAQP